MSYDAFEASVHGGSAVELYEFVRGSQTWRFTSRHSDVQWDGFTWTAKPMRRGDADSAREIGRANLTVEFDLADPFAAQFLGVIDGVTTLTVRRGHDGDADEEFIVYWRGRVATARPEGTVLGLECESIFTAVQRLGLRERFQRSCRHFVYRRGCRLDREAFAVPAVATGLAGLSVTAPAAAGFADGWFDAGMLLHAGVLRNVASHAGNQLTLLLPLPLLQQDLAANPGGVAVTLYPGCLRDRPTCENKFNNLDNYGGFDWIPLKNPLGGSSIV